jgi:hypothetical protein
MTDVVKIQLEWLEVQQGEPSKVHTAAHIFKTLGYEYRDQVKTNYWVALMCRQLLYLAIDF